MPPLSTGSPFSAARNPDVRESYTTKLSKKTKDNAARCANCGGAHTVSYPDSPGVINPKNHQIQRHPNRNKNPPRPPRNNSTPPQPPPGPQPQKSPRDQQQPEKKLRGRSVVQKERAPSPPEDNPQATPRDRQSPDGNFERDSNVEHEGGNPR
jgi:hypothetical protein